MINEYLNQGKMLLETGNPELALKYFEKAEDLDPSQKEIYLNKGIALATMERLEDAEKNFKKVLLADKKCGEAYFHMGCMSGLKGNLSEGIKYLDTAILNGFAGNDVLFTLGMMYEEMGNPNMALRNYNKVLHTDPTNIDAHIQKANVLIQNHRREEAVDALTVMISNCPEYYEGYHLKCRVLSELGKYDEALATLNQGIEMFPEEEGFEIDKARVLIMQEKLEEAEKVLEGLDQKNIDEWKRDILLELARVHGMQENAEKTKHYLERAYLECRTQEGPDEEISYLLMSVYMSEKDYEKMYSIAEELIQKSENTMYVNIASFYQAEALRMSGKESEAQEIYEETIKKCRTTVLKNPAAIDAYMIRALSLHRLGKHEQALEMIDYVIAVSEDSAELHTAKAVILKDLGREEEMQKEIALINEIGGKLANLVTVL